MKILILTQYFYPEQFRINDIVKKLVSLKNSVTVLTGLPNYPAGEIYESYESKANKWSYYFGAKIFRCNNRPRHSGSINLILNYLSFAHKSKKSLKQIGHDFDVTFVYGLSPVLQAYAAIKLKRKYGIPICYYCLDLWPEAVRGEHNGHNQKKTSNPIYIVSKILTKKIYKNVDLLLNKCEDFLEYNKLVNNYKGKQAVLYEHAEETYLSVNDEPIDNGIVDFMFLGNIGKVQNCDQIIKAFSKIENRSESFLHFVGDGTEKNNLIQLVKDLNLSDRIFFHDKCDVEEVIKYYNVADVCVLSLSSRTKTGLTIPAKLTSYMAASRPIVASIGGESRRIIIESESGFIANPDDVNDLTMCMNKCVKNKCRLIEFGHNGRLYFLKNFTKEIFINNLIKYLEELLNNEGAHNK